MKNKISIIKIKIFKNKKIVKRIFLKILKKIAKTLKISNLILVLNNLNLICLKLKYLIHKKTKANP